MIENDLVEAIIAVPENMFYNTGIGTFIWVLSNKKEDRRKEKIQLIDATAMKSALRKNMGKKKLRVYRRNPQGDRPHFPRNGGERSQHDTEQRGLRLLECDGGATAAFCACILTEQFRRIHSRSRTNTTA